MLSLVIDVTPALGPAYTLLRQRRWQVEMQETMGEVFALFRASPSGAGSWQAPCPAASSRCWPSAAARWAGRT
jgi:hypothetical protein